MHLKTRSPLKDKPLRLPGQSVAEEREDLVEDAVAQPMMLALFFVLIATLEWWRVYTNMKPNPIVFSGAALVAVIYAGYRVRRALPKLRKLRQAPAPDRKPQPQKKIAPKVTQGRGEEDQQEARLTGG
jgi:hypothetical protein